MIVMNTKWTGNESGGQFVNFFTHDGIHSLRSQFSSSRSETISSIVFAQNNITGPHPVIQLIEVSAAHHSCSRHNQI